MKILVLCTGNSCRSQMAEGLFRKYLLDKGLTEAASVVYSAGLEPGTVNPYAVKVMEEIWRISRNNAKVIIRVPYWNSSDCITDPTHRKQFNQY